MSHSNALFSEKDILYRDASVLVVHKAPGLATQTASPSRPDLTTHLLRFLARKNQTRNPYLAPITRLDQPVEGLVLYATNKRAASFYSSLVRSPHVVSDNECCTVRTSDAASGGEDRVMRISGKVLDAEARKLRTSDAVSGGEDRVMHNSGKVLDGEARKLRTSGTRTGGRMTKRYRAWVWGAFTASSGSLHDFLRKDPQASRANIVPEGADGAKEALLKYTVLREDVAFNEPISLVEVELLTGRFHQIRAQFANAHHPLLGDLKYGTDASLSLSQRLSIPYVRLCCTFLSFPDPDHRRSITVEKIPEIYT